MLLCQVAVAEFAESLQRMFDGHDVIAETPEGQAFWAFAKRIATPSQRAQLERDITEISEWVAHRIHRRDVAQTFADVRSCTILLDSTG